MSCKIFHVWIFNLLKRSLTKHSSGLYLLPRPVELHDTLAITDDSIRKVIGLLKASFTHLIIDLSKTYSAVDMAAIENATRVVLVTQLDLPCLRNVVRLMMSFEEIEGLQSKVEIVVNRAGLDSGQISLKKAKETLGTRSLCVAAERLSNDGRSPQQRRATDRPGTQSRDHAGDPRLGSQALKANMTKLAEGEEADGESQRKQVEKILAGHTKA